MSQKNRHPHSVALQEVEQTIPQSVQFTYCKVSICLGNTETEIYEEWLHYSKDQTAKLKYHGLRWKGWVKKNSLWSL